MGFLNRAWTFNFIFYFIDYFKNKKILLITDNHERLDLSFNLFDLDITYCIPDFDKTEFIVGNKKLISCEILENSIPDNHFSILIFDLNKHFSQGLFNLAIKKWDKSGQIIYLDWRKSWKDVFKKLSFHLNSKNIKKNHFLETRNYKVHGRKFNLLWYFLIEPGLNRPKHLIKRGFQTIIPELSASRIKNIINRFGGFYFKPHTKILVFQNHEEKNSIVYRTIHDLKEKINFEGEINSNAMRWILISSTKVLIVYVRLGERGYILRFPLNLSSLERLEHQSKILSILDQNGISFSPKFVNIYNKDLGFHVFIEEKIKGIKEYEVWIKRNILNIEKVYQGIYPKIESLHLKFGKHKVIDENLFNKYISNRISTIELAIKNNQYSIKVRDIKEQLYKYLYNKNALLSLCHGDLKIPNCIYDNCCNVQGIIDWDMARTNDLSFFDVCSLLAHCIRLKYYKNRSLKDFMLSFKKMPNEFLKLYYQYFKHTQTTVINPYVAILLYWIDRVDKILTFNPDFGEEWLEKNAFPVLERASYFLTKFEMDAPV